MFEPYIFMSEGEGEIRREIIRELGEDSTSLVSVIHQIKTCVYLRLVLLKNRKKTCVTLSVFFLFKLVVKIDERNK